MASRGEWAWLTLLQEALYVIDDFIEAPPRQDAVQSMAARRGEGREGGGEGGGGDARPDELWVYAAHRPARLASSHQSLRTMSSPFSSIPYTM